MDIYNKPTDSKLCPICIEPPTVLFNKYTIFSCKKNMYHCCEWKCERKALYSKKTLLEQKFSNSLIEVCIVKAKEIPIEVLGQPETTKNEEVILFVTTHNPNNRNIFL